VLGARRAGPRYEGRAPRTDEGGRGAEKRREERGKRNEERGKVRPGAAFCVPLKGTRRAHPLRGYRREGIEKKVLKGMLCAAEKQKTGER